MTKLKDLAAVIRSKNAGALLLTLDVMFDDAATYARVRDAGVISPPDLSTSGTPWRWTTRWSLSRSR